MEKHILIKVFMTVFMITLVSMAVAAPIDNETVGTQNAAITTDGQAQAVSNGKIAFVSQRDGNDEIYTINADGSNVQRLTVDVVGSPKSDISPAWSPDGTRIAFVSNRDGNYEIYVMNADGSNQQRLTYSSDGDIDPTWSPDGTRIVFATNRDTRGLWNGYELYVMNTDGSNQQRLTYNSVDDISPTWSPNGTRIAFASNRDGNYEIYVMNSDGSNQQRRTSNTAADGNPAWSPNGTRIVFVRNVGLWNAEIYIINADACQECAGTPPIDLSNSPNADSDPNFSPDGTRIAFTTNRDGNYEIYTMNPDGTGKINVTNSIAPDSEPDWQSISATLIPIISINDVTLTEPNSDTRNFIFTVTRSGDSTGSSSVNFSTANGTATAPSDYALNSGTLNFESGETNKTVSVVVKNDTSGEPDETFLVNLSNCIGCIITDSHGVGTILSGKAVSNGKIAFVSQRDGNDEIYTMNSDGSNVQRLTFDVIGTPKIDMSPTWSPDGTRIAFVSNRDGNYEIYVMNEDGSNQQRLTYSSDSDLNPTWSPDGTRIAFASNRDTRGLWNGYEIYVMNTDGSNQQRLTYNTVDDIFPVWSPDGTRIAFSTNRDGNYEIYLMNGDASNQQRMTSNTAVDGNPAWSHDGTRIIFVRNFGLWNADIYIMNADACQECRGTPPTDISRSSGAEVEPAFSPDGTIVAFATDRDGNSEIYLMNPDGSEQTRITTNTVSDGELSWQPTSVTLLPAISINDVTLTEPDYGIRNFFFTVTRSGDITGISSVNFSTTNGTATAPSDYASNSATLYFEAGETTKNVSVVVKNGTTLEPDEMFFVNLSNCIGCIITDSHGIGTILSGQAVFNGKIAFVSKRDGNDEIYTMNADGSGQTRLTTNTAIDVNPAWSPDGTRIAFVSHRDGNDEIYVMNEDGSNQQRLTSSSDGDLNPTWSPDGTRIAFATNRDTGAYNGYEIYVMNADGSNQQRLTSNTIDDGLAAWSPDGTRIAFATNRDGNYEIYIMNADGSNQQRMTFNTAIDGSPAWSHDGTKIIFVRNFGLWNADIYIMNSDACQECKGTPLTDISRSSSAEVEPAFSPDGTRIAFSTDRDSNYEIYLMNPDGSEQTKITTNTASDRELSWQPTSAILRPVISINDVTLREPNSGIRNFVFTVTRSGNIAGASSVNFGTANGTATAPSDYASKFGTLFFAAGETTKTVTVAVKNDTSGEPDETFLVNLSNCIGCIITDSHGIGTILSGQAVSNGKIAFVSKRDGNDEIYTMNADGSGQTRLTTNTAIDVSPAWSPDGTRIAFVSHRDSNDEIYVMNEDGSNQQRLTFSNDGDLNPTWSPDGTRIAFATNRDTGAYNKYEIYVMNADGSNPQKLTNNTIDDLLPAWSPDGTRIAFATNRDGNYEIYVMNADGSNQLRRTSNTAIDGSPAWSHDGTRIAFVRNFGYYNAEIYVMNADACQECTSIPPIDLSGSSNADQYPTFSPDGTRIAFATNRDGNNEIYVMNSDGSEQIRITTNTASDLELSWQPVPLASDMVPPVAVCSTSKLTCENFATPVQFNASASYDSDGAIVSYDWDFGDGTNGTGVSPVHTYTTYRWNGTAYLPFTVNLNVMDNSGLTSSTSQKVVIWIAGDANGDGSGNILDASVVGLKWGTDDPCADLNNDGNVNILDASIIGLNWGKTPLIQ